MLSMSAMSAGQAGYYLGLATEDYYLKGGEPPGQWYGQGADALGLVGTVEDQQLYNLFGGYSPGGDKLLIQLQRHEDKAAHRPGWDLTFSAPKSVSALWSQVGEEQRQLLQSAHHQAVTAALDYLQETAAKTRRGKGGFSIEDAGPIVAIFEHSTSRALDPQLHSHALVMNIGVRDDGSTGTLSSLSLFQSKMVAGALYRLHLAGILEKEFGIPLHKVRTWFEISGVPGAVIEEFSKRREAIEAELDRRGLDSAQAAAVVATETREVKEGVSRSQLFEEWHRVSEALGWSRADANRLFNSIHIERDAAHELEQAANLACEHLTLSQAHFTERDFVRAMAEEAQVSGLKAEELVDGARKTLAQSSEIIRLGWHNGEDRFTTRAMFELEKSLLLLASKLDQNRFHAVSQEVAVKALSEFGELSEEQMNAVWHITAGTGALAIVSGMAGTGKTRMLNAARDIWERDGFTVEGTALAARAVNELSQGAEIESNTIAKLLYEAEQGRLNLGRKTILVVDEAGMVATPELQRLTKLCQEAGSKLVLIGDERQLQPIGPGAPFMELGERYGQAELQDIRRQHEAWARQAVKDLAEGRAQEALDAFIARGLVKVTETRAEAMQALIDDWQMDGKALRDTLILAGTRADTEALNRLAQGARLRKGEVDEAEIEIAGKQFRQGDRVMFTKKYAALGVVNGDRGTLSRFDPLRKTASVTLDSGERVSFEIEAMEHLVLGYASTTHKGQGATTLRTYVLAGGPMQDREMSYVQGSRAREETTFYMTRIESGDEIAQLAREMERSRQKEMAHTVIRNHTPKFDYDL